MVIARKIAYNVLVSTVSKILATILALVSIGLITRYLGKEGFGNYATVMAFFAFFGAVGDLGLYTVSTREISRPGADASKIMSNVFTIRIISSLLIALTAPLIVIFFPYPQEVKYAIIIVAASFFFSSAYQVLNGVFQKNLAIDKIAISELTGKILQVSLIAVAVKYDLGFQWVISPLLFYMILSFLLILAWSRKYVKLRIRFDFEYWKKILKESYPIGVVSIVTFVYFKIDTIILSVMKSSADVGIYNAAYKVIENISFFPGMIIGLIFPIMSQHIFSDREKFRDISDKTFKIFVILVVPLIIGTMFLSEGIINLIGGIGFDRSSDVLRILIFSLAFIFFGNFFNAVIISANQQKKLMYVLVFAAIFNVTANLLLIPSSATPYFSAAFVATLTEFFVASATLYLVVNKIKYYPKAEKFWAIIVSGAAMAAFLFVFSDKNFFAIAFGSVLVYIIFLWLLKAIRTEEIMSIISKKGISTGATESTSIS
jgi:O-antigen/teichoic acid export membrane protein